MSRWREATAGRSSTSSTQAWIASGSANTSITQAGQKYAARRQRPDRASRSRDRPTKTAAWMASDRHPHRPSMCDRRRIRRSDAPRAARRPASARRAPKRPDEHDGEHEREHARQARTGAHDRASRRARSRCPGSSSGRRSARRSPRAPAASERELDDRERPAERRSAAAGSTCCRQNASSPSTFPPRRQKPARPGEPIGGRTVVPSSALASSASARASRSDRRPEARRAPGTTSGVIARTAQTAHPATRITAAAAPTGSASRR